MSGKCSVCNRPMWVTTGNIGPKCAGKCLGAIGLVSTNKEEAIELGEILSNKKPADAVISLLNHPSATNVSDDEVIEAVLDYHEIEKQPLVGVAHHPEDTNNDTSSVIPTLSTPSSSDNNDDNSSNNDNHKKTDENLSQRTAPLKKEVEENFLNQLKIELDKHKESYELLEDLGIDPKYIVKDQIPNLYANFPLSNSELATKYSAEDLGLTEAEMKDKKKLTLALNQKKMDIIKEAAYYRINALNYKYHKTLDQLEKTTDPDKVLELAELSERQEETIKKIMADNHIGLSGHLKEQTLKDVIKSLPAEIKNKWNEKDVPAKLKGFTKETARSFLKIGMGISSVVAGEILCGLVDLRADLAKTTGRLNKRSSNGGRFNKQKSEIHKRFIANKFSGLFNYGQVANDNNLSNDRANKWNKKSKQYDKIQKKKDSSGWKKDGGNLFKGNKAKKLGETSWSKTQYKQTDYQRKLLKEDKIALRDGVSAVQVYKHLGTDKVNSLKKLSNQKKAEKVKAYLKTKKMGISRSDLLNSSVNDIQKKMGEKNFEKLTSHLKHKDAKLKYLKDLVSDANEGQYLAFNLKHQPSQNIGGVEKSKSKSGKKSKK